MHNKPPQFGSPMNPADLLSQLQGNQSAMDILGHYGLSVPNTLRENFVLPEPGTPGFFGQHPRLSQGIENAFLGLAAMGPTSMSAGENISNVARSVLAVPQMRREHMMMQLMAPFQTAQMLGEVDKNQAQAYELRQRGQYYGERGDYYARGGANREYTSIIKNPGQPMLGMRRDGTTEPILGPDRQPVMVPAHQASAADPGKILFWRAMGLDPDQAKMAPKDRTDSMKAAGAMLHSYNQSVADRSGMGEWSRLLAMQHQPGFLTEAQKQSMTNTRDTVNANIRSWQGELKSLNDVKGAAKWMAAQNFPDEASARAGLTAHKKELQDNIDFHSRALNDYPVAASNVPGLTYDQYIATLRNNPNKPEPAAPEITPLRSGSSAEDEADRFLNNLPQ